MKKDGIGLIPASQVGSVFNEALDPPFSCQRPLFDILTVLAYSFYVAALGLSGSEELLRLAYWLVHMLTAHFSSISDIVHERL